MRRKTKKIYAYVATAVLVIALSVLGSFVERTPLYERAIVLGLALDKNDNGVTLLIQTVVNGNNTTPGAASAYDVVEGSGNSLSEAMEAVAKKSGLKPSYAHCELIIVGGEYLQDGFDESAKLLFEKTIVQDNTHIIATEGKAEDVIKARVPVVSTPSEYVTNDLKIYADEGSACVVTLKDYVQRTYDEGTRLMTAAKRIKANPPTASDTGEQKGEFCFFDLDNVAAKDVNGNLHFYGKEISDGRNLVESTKGQFLSVNNDDKKVSVSVTSKTRSTTYSKEPAITTNLIYYVKIEENNGYESNESLVKLLQEEISKKIKRAYDVCAADDVDLFSLRSTILKKYGISVPFKNIRWNINVKVVIR